MTLTPGRTRLQTRRALAGAHILHKNKTTATSGVGGRPRIAYKHSHFNLGDMLFPVLSFFHAAVYSSPAFFYRKLNRKRPDAEGCKTDRQPLTTSNNKTWQNWCIFKSLIPAWMHLILMLSTLSLCLMNIPRESKKKQDTLFLPITLRYVDRFSKFFHRRTQL